jgi:purine-binding chemotaxis protein CheW
MGNIVSNKYLTFSLGSTIFGISVLKTREIVEYGKITPVPDAPEYVTGVINLRGFVVPVVDLTKKLFKENTKLSETTSIIIVEPTIDNEKNIMGIVVDCVKDVLELKKEDMASAPKYGTRLKSENITGVSNYNDDFILIMDIDYVLSQVELNGQMAKIIKSNEILQDNEKE